MGDDDGSGSLELSDDFDKYCGAGQCALAAPEVFDQRDEDGIVVLLDANPPEGQYENVRQAANTALIGRTA